MKAKITKAEFDALTERQQGVYAKDSEGEGYTADLEKALVYAQEQKDHTARALDSKRARDTELETANGALKVFQDAEALKNQTNTDDLHTNGKFEELYNLEKSKNGGLETKYNDLLGTNEKDKIESATEKAMLSALTELSGGENALMRAYLATRLTAVVGADGVVIVAPKDGKTMIDLYTEIREGDQFQGVLKGRGAGGGGGIKNNAGGSPLPTKYADAFNIESPNLSMQSELKAESPELYEQQMGIYRQKRAEANRKKRF